MLPYLLPELAWQAGHRGGRQRLQEQLEDQLKNGLLHAAHRAQEVVELLVRVEYLMEDADRLAVLLLGQGLVGRN